MPSTAPLGGNSKIGRGHSQTITIDLTFEGILAYNGITKFQEVVMMYRILDRVFTPIFQRPVNRIVGAIFWADGYIHHVNLRARTPQ